MTTAVVLGLLSAAPDDRAASVRDLVDAGLFPRATAFAAVTMHVASTGGEPANRDVVRDAIRKATMARPRTSVASAVSDSDSLVVVGGVISPSDLSELATSLHRELKRPTPPSGSRSPSGSAPRNLGWPTSECHQPTQPNKALLA